MGVRSDSSVNIARSGHGRHNRRQIQERYRCLHRRFIIDGRDGGDGGDDGCTLGIIRSRTGLRF